MISRNALSLCLSPRSTRKEARLTLFFLFFFQGTAFLPSAGVIILSYYFSSANFVAPFHAAGRIPASLLCPSGWIRGEDRPIMPRNASRFVNVGDERMSLKEPSGLVSRFLRGREDGAEIRNDFHFLYRANYVQRCFFLSFFLFSTCEENCCTMERRMFGFRTDRDTSICRLILAVARRN